MELFPFPKGIVAIRKGGTPIQMAAYRSRWQASPSRWRPRRSRRARSLAHGGGRHPGGARRHPARRLPRTTRHRRPRMKNLTILALFAILATASAGAQESVSDASSPRGLWVQPPPHPRPGAAAPDDRRMLPRAPACAPGPRAPRAPGPWGCAAGTSAPDRALRGSSPPSAARRPRSGPSVGRALGGGILPDSGRGRRRPLPGTTATSQSVLSSCDGSAASRACGLRYRCSRSRTS